MTDRSTLPPVREPKYPIPFIPDDALSQLRRNGMKALPPKGQEPMTGAHVEEEDDDARKEGK